MAVRDFDTNVVAVQKATLHLKNQIASAEASPFLGHHTLENALRDRVATAIASMVSGDAERFVSLFRTYPLVCAWHAVSSLAAHYGHDGHLEIYGPIAQAIRVSGFEQSTRASLNKAFRAACFRYALPLPPIGAMDRTEDYVVQAGVAHSQVAEMVRAFLRAERDYGPPPIEDTADLNVWSLQAIAFASSGMIRLRRVIQYDTAGYHAAAFERIRRTHTANTPFETKLLDALQQAKNDAKLSGAIALKAPGLCFGGGELALELPRGAKPLRVTWHGRERRLIAGERMAMPDPWPQSATWSVDGGEPVSMPIVENSDGLAFDATTGRLIRRFPLVSGEVTLDAPVVHLISRSRFRIDGDESTAVGQDAEVVSH